MSWTSPKRIKLRILGVSFQFVLFLGLVLFRSYQLQISENSRVHRLVSKQYRATLPVASKRGAIYDRNGHVLAMDLKVASIAAHPHLIEDKKKASGQLAAILGLPSDEILKKLKSGNKFVWVARRIPNAKGEAIEKEKLKAVSIIPEYRRFYPNKESAGNFLGAVGYDAKALSGIELGMDSYLKVASSEVVAQKDAKGRLYTPVSEKGMAHDLHLTIDLNLQYIAEKYLWKAAFESQAASGFAIIQDPKTGELLAMANYPMFNPNVYWKYAMPIWKNHAVMDVYEPGSTFKTILISAALESQKVTTKDKFFCENGTYQIRNRVIHDHNPYGNMTLLEILAVSSNIGVTKIAQKIGATTYESMIRAFGFGALPDVGLPGEHPGLLAPAKKWKDIDLSNIAFGQGIAVNGLQMAQAYSAIANGGQRMKPYFISKIVDSKGTVVYQERPELVQEVVSVETAREVSRMLEAVVFPAGTGRLAHLEEYPVAGKTGTAQKVNASTKNYDTKNFVSSFIGFAPATNPELMIYVLLDSPKGVHAGGVVAAPVFREIAREALAYRGVIPEGPSKTAQISKLDWNKN